MTFNEIVEAVKEMNISDEDTLAFRAAVVILFGCTNNTWNIMRIKRATDYFKKDVEFFIHNLRANNFIIGYEFYWDEGELTVMDITLASLAASGELVRCDEKGVCIGQYGEIPIKYQLYDR